MNRRRLGPPSLTHNRQNGSGSIVVEVAEQAILLSHRPYTAYVVRLQLSPTEFSMTVHLLDGFSQLHTQDREFQRLIRQLAVNALRRMYAHLGIGDVESFVKFRLPELYKDDVAGTYSPDYPDQGFLTFTYRLI